MNRFLNYLNLCGVIVLTVLCVVQWQHDRRQNQQILKMSDEGVELQTKLGKAEHTSRTLEADLGWFKEQFTQSNTNLQEVRLKLETLTRENDQLVQQHDHLKQTLTNWSEAVAKRDEVAKDANSRITFLSEQLNDSIKKFNDLTVRYNELVKDYNELQKKAAASTSPTVTPPTQ